MKCERVAILLLRDAVAAHALARVVDLAQDILSDDVTGADDAHSDGDGRAVPTEPAPCGAKHVGKTKLPRQCRGTPKSTKIASSVNWKLAAAQCLVPRAQPCCTSTAAWSVLPRLQHCSERSRADSPDLSMQP